MNANTRALLRGVVKGMAKGWIVCAVIGLLAWPWLIGG